MRLREIRKKKKMTVLELSKKTGIPKRTIEDIEKRGDCKVSAAIKLADVLEISLDELCKNVPGYYAGFDKEKCIIYEAKILKNGILKTRIWDCHKGKYIYQMTEGEKQVVLQKAKELEDIIIF